RRENTNVNTAIVASGWMMAQPKPKSDWLYRPLTSRFVRLTSSSQYADAPTRSAQSESAGTAAGIVDTVVAVMQRRASARPHQSSTNSWRQSLDSVIGA